MSACSYGGTRPRLGGCSDVDGNGMLVIHSGGGREGGRPIVKIRNMFSEKTDPLRLRFEFESRKETILHLLREIRATLLEKSAVGRPSASACLLPILMPMLTHGRRHDISNVHLRTEAHSRFVGINNGRTTMPMHPEFLGEQEGFLSHA